MPDRGVPVPPAPADDRVRPRRALLPALIAGQLGLHAAMAGLRMAAPLQALREGYSAWAVGVLLALFAAAPVLLALHAGRLADRHGHHRPVRIATALVVAGMAAAVGATFVDGTLHFALLCAAAMLSGSGANMGLLTIQRSAGQLARGDTERIRIFSWLGIAPSLANVVGPVSAGLVIDAAGFGAAYAVLMLLPLATLVSTRFVPRGAARPAPAPPPGRRAWELLAEPGFKRLLFVNWLLSMCWDVHNFAVPILGHERGISATVIGLVLGTFTLSVSLVRVVIPWLAHRLEAAQVVPWAMLGTGVVFALYPLAPNAAWMASCAALLGVTLGCVQPMIMTTLHRLTPGQRHGEALAFRSMAMNGSSTVMPLVFGAAGAVVGAGVMFWLVGAAVGAGALAARRLAAPAART
jgi:MFS family permease